LKNKDNIRKTCKIFDCKKFRILYIYYINMSTDENLKKIISENKKFVEKIKTSQKSMEAYFF